jgi:CRP-like cAMP-binding protein
MNYSTLWANLSSDIEEVFDKNAQHLEFKRGELIYQASETPKGIYFIETGLVGFLIIGKDSGKEHLLRFFKTGQFFGHRSLFSGEEYYGNSIALESTRLRLIPKNVILNVLDNHPILYKEIVMVIAKELRRCESQHVMILENQIIARTAQAILYLKDLHPDHNWTRQEIANFCASTVSTIIKAMAELEDMGYIAQKGRAIEILQREALLNLEGR